MSGNGHYELLGVNENSSFDEIQEARNNLLADKGGDRKQTEAIEAAYDAILMDRLRLRTLPPRLPSKPPAGSRTCLTSLSCLTWCSQAVCSWAWALWASF
jgi:hypothetical protein